MSAADVVKIFSFEAGTRDVSARSVNSVRPFARSTTKAPELAPAARIWPVSDRRSVDSGAPAQAGATSRTARRAAMGASARRTSQEHLADVASRGAPGPRG